MVSKTTAVPVPPHPAQPLYLDRRGRVRFLSNPIVYGWVERWERKTGRTIDAALTDPQRPTIALNDLDQFAQLRGWTLDEARAAGFALGVEVPSDLPRTRGGLVRPLQPLIEDAVGRLRFKENAAIGVLLSEHNCMNDLFQCFVGVPDCWDQVAQLVGYSFDGAPSYLYPSSKTRAFAEWSERAARFEAERLAQRWPSVTRCHPSTPRL